MKNAPTTTRQRCLDLQEEVTYIFRIISSGSQKFQARALARFLTKPAKFTSSQPLRGILSDYALTQVQQLIYLLIDRNFINESSNALFLTEKGRRYLLQPQPVMVWENQLRLKSMERSLYQALRKLRQLLGTKEEVRPYIIFPDHSMDELVRKLPQDLDELQQIYGWGPNRCNKYGAAVLSCIQEIKAAHKNSRFQELLSRSKRNSYQEVKSLYLAGESPQAIADKRKVKVSTVQNMLSELYEI
ncbi:MAG: HRDC domain-containing protein, partial [Bacteroidota bacterium]